MNDEEEEDEMLAEDGAQNVLQPPKLKSKDIDIATFELPEWSPLLQLEIKEGRLYLDENQRLVKEEVSWYLVKKYGTIPPQGLYTKYSKFLLDVPTFKILREVGTEQYWTGLASKISIYLRRQRELLKKRREEQASQGMVPVNAANMKVHQDLESLRSTDVSPNRAKELLRSTFLLRKAMGYIDYKDVLDKESYLRNPHFLFLEIQNWLDALIPNVQREQKFNDMISKLREIFPEETVNLESELEKIRLISETYKATLNKTHERREAPFDTLEVVPNKSYSFQKANALPFTVTVLYTREKGIKYAMLLGTKDVIGKMKCKSAREVVEIWLGAFMALRQPVPASHLHLSLFLKWALLDIQIPSGVRTPKHKLQMFLRQKYQIVNSMA
ncbi:uncharacterized protein LOC113215780 [Frankliniella occidentalis]|uniref:Uncharacterized protein LOC113215780 n=1 Tax=Frankliniella occidentalis TaxID=133901 RepID=A0A9C6U4F6_FRAOC|nr:uncharacterized protein LOC113215780 [Frankliniella occidentalis]